MSGLARISLAMGYAVSGSDIKESRMTTLLRREGAQIHIGHDAEHIQGATMVVVSSAILGSNPEVVKAEELGIPVLPRAELLARLAEGRKAIAVAGTHGKTTTTSMIAKILMDAGLDPTYVIGGELNDIGSNARFGAGEYLVAEADESDGSLLYLHPMYMVITNVEADHLDYYGTFDNVLKVFDQFMKQRSLEGESFICGEDDKLCRIARESGMSYVSYGIFPGNRVTAQHVRLGSMTSLFDVCIDGEKKGTVTLRIPGEHNVRNAIAAFAVADHIGVTADKIIKSLAGFSGVQRRFQQIGVAKGAEVVDDYAHHPTEVMNTLKAARNGTWRRIIAVFQPHRFSRTHYFHEEFGRAFTYADIAVITEVYGAGETPIPGVSAKLIVESVLQNDPARKVVYLPHKSEIKDYLNSEMRDGDLVLMMGAGDIGALGFELVAEQDEDLKAVNS